MATTSAASALAARSGRLAIAAIAVAVGLVGVAALHDPAQPDDVEAPTPQTVTRLAYACPAFAERGGADPSAVMVGRLPGSGADGERSAVRLPGDGRAPALTGAVAGGWSIAAPKADTEAVRIVADGAVAPGTAAYAAVEASDDLGGGLAVTGCGRAGTEHWFAAAGTTAEHRTALQLTTTTAQQAVVDVTVYGPSGPIEAPGGAGIVVEPDAPRTVRLDRLAAGVDELAVRVDVRRGAVSVAAADVRADGLLPAGSEWLPEAAAPARDQVLTGAVKADGERTLVIANPTDRRAVVEPSVQTADATFTPTGLESIEVGPESIATVKLPGDVGEDAFTLRLSSDVAVTAALRTVVDDDATYTAAGEPWKGQAIVPMDLGDAPAPTRLLLGTDAEDPTTVRLEAYDDTGEQVGSTQVELQPGRTGDVALNEKTLGTDPSDASYLTLTAKDPVRGTVAFTDGGLASYPMVAAPVAEPAPAVRPAP
ncbi:UNVERIFIED_CONTAM: hypothetical protein LK11_16415 [Mumia flava]